MKDSAVSMEDNLWGFVVVRGYKSHYVPKQLVSALLVDLQERRASDYPGSESDWTTSVKSVTDGEIDLPGLCMVDRPYEEIRIDSFSLMIPSQDFETIKERLESSKLRRFANGQKYYKVHGWRTCVVFTPEQRDTVLESMRENMTEVRDRRREANRELRRRLESANGEHGLEIPVLKNAN